MMPEGQPCLLSLVVGCERLCYPWADILMAGYMFLSGMTGGENFWHARKGSQNAVVAGVSRSSTMLVPGRPTTTVENKRAAWHNGRSKYLSALRGLCCRIYAAGLQVLRPGSGKLFSTEMAQKPCARISCIDTSRPYF